MSGGGLLRARVALMFALGLAVYVHLGEAQTGKIGDPYQVPRATSEVMIDGVVEDEEWSEALRLELRYEVSPGENTEPPVRTVVFMTYDEHHVLVAFKAYDPDPSTIRARYRDRDTIMGDDNVGVTLDTFNDERRAYEFWVNPLGAQMDAIYNDVEKHFDRSWDAIWLSAGRLTDFGYEVELAVPFNQIRFQPTHGPQVWGLDLTRTWPRSDHVRIGLFPRERGANSYLAQEDKIIGFEGVSPGRNLEFAPTLTGFTLQERPDFPDSVDLEKNKDLDLGATVRWGVTPNITLSGAVNPDFSQIEADAVQLAINERFTLFFDEKRPFFLESSDYFETSLDLLYTRMIADPSAALKVTGKLGRHTVGLFSALDGVTNLVVPGVEASSSGTYESSNTSTVARYRYDLGADSTAGAIFTDREGADGYFNRVFAIDSRLRPTESDSLTIDAAWSSTQYSPEMRSDLELTGEEISDHALAVEYQHTTRDWFAFAEYRDFGNDFRADLGFIPQVGFRDGNLGAGYIWWGEEDTWYNRLEVGGFVARSQDQDGELLSDRGQIWFEGQGPSQSNFHLELGRQTEVYEGVRFDNMVVPALSFRMRPSAWFRFHLFVVAGDWIDFTNVQPADRVRVRGEIEFNLGRHFELEIEYLHSSLDVAGGRLYEAKVPQLSAIWQFNTRTFVRVIVQITDVNRDPDLYLEEVDALNRDSFVQLLFSYKVNPQTVAFLGYSEGAQQTTDIPRTTTGRAVFAKIGYAWLW
ncbi:MAG: DUF5916 domain-containing protein [Acidobacteriota bacterium]|nr:DUF5916 domain-containing protein [Acidobacteriota bacterium]